MSPRMPMTSSADTLSATLTYGGGLSPGVYLVKLRGHAAGGTIVDMRRYVAVTP